MKYYVIAGEASGDLHGSNLIRGLAAEDHNALFRFWGGDLMSEAAGGVPPVRHYRDGAVMGAVEVLAKAGKLLSNIRFCKRDILSWNPDVVILIDYPGFNMKIAQFCHKKGFRVYYYIAPKTWASRENRNRKLKAWVDRLFIVFPFEIPYFREKGIPFTYKGNPLIDAIDGHEYRRLCEDRYIAILAGSRKAEIFRTMPVCMKVVDALSCLPEYSGFKFIVAGAPARKESDYSEFIGGRSNVSLIFGRTYDILKFAESAIVNSGTASLEAALIGTPQVVCWSTSWITAFIARYLLKVLDRVKYISLGNLCLDKLAFKELIQSGFNVEAVTTEVRSITEDKQRRAAMFEDYRAIREALGGQGASKAVARAMIDDMKR